MKPIIFGLLLISLCASLPLQATDLERSQLADLVKELDYLCQRVEAIEVEAPDPNPEQRRLRFQYADLKRDLLRVREGISDYIDADLRLGRDLIPIQGSYR